ncbi:MAG: hypothetical protein ACKVQT_03875 [Burkholderiales bacterium]
MSEQQPAKRGGVALEKHYQFLFRLVRTVDKFPRTQKFLLGDRIQTAALNVLDGLVEATYTREAGPILGCVNLELEAFRAGRESTSRRLPWLSGGGRWRCLLRS